VVSWRLRSGDRFAFTTIRIQGSFTCRQIEFEMMPSDIQLIAKAAEKACAAAINHPHNKDVRGCTGAADRGAAER